ncbi:DUF2312 domain-containing protein [Deltaproteobacteria bacterium]|nr:DUF2312 domain-containing protein [Deltaproteobacteria bacterium]
MDENNEVEVEGVAAEQLSRFIDRIERQEEEKAGISSRIKEIYAEAKGQGFDVAIMRQIVRLRKKDPHEIDEEAAILLIYKKALGLC